ncbi:MAG TPA: ferritin-like domain-containing protein [Chloroflexota bacterium]|nr:ferritin-like domain-containing protein [Chloroflexota bacterium]
MEQRMENSQEAPRSSGSREHFLRTAGLTGTATFLGLLALANNPLHAGSAHAQSELAALSDVDILNFALSLEYLEAEFYREAMASNKLTGLSQSLVSEIYGDEVSHAVVISTAIALVGGMPVAKQSHYNFGDMSTRDAILKTAEVLEMTGVGAYTGAAPLIKSKVVLAAAASVEQIEARHYAAIRFVRDELPAPSAFGPSLSVAQVKAATKPIFGM